MSPRNIASAALLALACAIGCNSGPAKCYVEGKVTWNGNPVTGCHIVLFDPSAGGGSAPLDEKGDFRLDGFIHPGDQYLVTFVVPVSPQDEKSLPKVADVPAKYRQPTTSDLRVKIKAGNNRLDLDLSP